MELYGFRGWEQLISCCDTSFVFQALSKRDPQQPLPLVQHSQSFQNLIYTSSQTIPFPPLYVTVRFEPKRTQNAATNESADDETPKTKAH